MIEYKIRIISKDYIIESEKLKQLVEKCYNYTLNEAQKSSIDCSIGLEEIKLKTKSIGGFYYDE